MMPYKRPAADKSGVPVYQPNATTYQQLMQLQQPFVPVSCEYSSSPTPTSASASASPPSVTNTEPQLVPATASQLPQIAPPPSQQQQQKDNEAARPASTPAAPQMSALPPPAIPDPAALAKEVAHQNYAKAVKLAAANQQFATLNHLNPLNYTGVALNKQALSVPPPQPTFARYPAALPLGLGFGLGNPYAAASAMAQSNFLNMTRPHQSVINPYALMRSPYTATTTHQQLLAPGFLGAHQYPVSVAATPITSVPPATMTAAAVQNTNNNNNVTLPPYKKLKTT